MKEYITFNRTANAVMLKEDSFDSFLILEGEFDELLFRKFINMDKCKIEIGFGYDNVLKILEILNDRGFIKALGIIDSDFRILDGEEIKIKNVITTDFHDLEMSTINSEAFQNVMSFYIQNEKVVAKYENIENFRNHIFTVLKPLSFLKWLNKKQNLGLIFKPRNPEGNNLDLNKFICSTNLTFTNTEKLVKSVLDYCNGKVNLLIKKEEIKRQLDEFINEETDINHLLNGHDVISLAAISLKKHVSNLNSKSVASEQLQKEFYLAYDSRFFQNTELYNKIKFWETKIPTVVLTF
ncbi:hypothetical protein FM120_36880 [Sphingobacterium faecium PCAi_F2.5]|nr:hypothetical protein FM120_36880 [Sphingobacterium faecium PCAi_F2.5]